MCLVRYRRVSAWMVWGERDAGISVYGDENSEGVTSGLMQLNGSAYPRITFIRHWVHAMLVIANFLGDGVPSWLQFR